MRRLLLITLLAGPAHADNVPHKEGDYGGVVPGQKPDTGKPKRPPPKGTLTWIGFEAKDGGAQLFLQSVAPFEVTQRVEGATLVVHANLKRLDASTWRPIETRFFDNPLARIHAKVVRASRGGKGRSAHGTGVDIRITFKNPRDAREASVRTATEADGMSYVYLSFPAGTPVPGAGPSAAPEPE